MSAIGSTLSSNRAFAEVSQAASQNTATVPAPSGQPQAAARSDTAVGDPQREFVRVSSSIGRAASAGQLSRQEAIAIYRQIASLL